MNNVKNRNILEINSGSFHNGLLYMDRTISIFGSNALESCDMEQYVNKNIESVITGGFHTAII